VLAVLALTVAPVVGSLVEFFDTDRWGREVELAGGAEVEGDPTRDDRMQARIEAEDRQAEVTVDRTLAGLVDESPRSQAIREASPTGPAQAQLRLAAGPVERAEAGEVSPAFALQARVSVDGDEGFETAWLRLDGDRWTELEPAGWAGDRRILLGELAARTLPAGETTHVDVVFEREPAPGARHVVQGPGFDVFADAEGPPEPTLAIDEGTIRVGSGAEEVHAQARTPGEDWRPVPVREGSIDPAGEGPLEVRARGVDAVGNAGPWSPTHRVETVTEPDPAPTVAFQLRAPDEGQTIEGVAAVDWRPADRAQVVAVEARSAEHGNSTISEGASQPPVRWRTGFVPDGEWTLHVRAQTPQGLVSELVTVTVDNLEHGPAGDGVDDDGSVPSRDPVQRTRSPLSAALASGAGALALVALAGRAWKRRPK